MLVYSIEEKDEFFVIGKANKYIMETAYKEIPKAWNEHFSGDDKNVVNGTYGICYDMDESSFGYMIADDYKQGSELPSGFTTKLFKKTMWAVFPCKGALPQAIQEVTMKIWDEWLPNNVEYSQSGDYYIEYYTDCDPSTMECYSEIWIPVKRK